MRINGEQRITAAREDVWTALNDPQTLRLCIPGGDNLERISESEFDGTVTAKAQVDGKLAQIGSRLIDSTVRKLSGQFFANLSEHLEACKLAAATPASEATTTIFDDLRLKAWTVGLIVLALLLAGIFWATGGSAVTVYS
jgi:hypothetical protein